MSLRRIIKDTMLAGAMIFIFAIIFLLGCDRSSTDIPDPKDFPTATENVISGWASYELAVASSDSAVRAKKLEEAVSHFKSALERNASYSDAYNGLGWAYLQQGIYTFSLSNFAYVLALEDPATNPSYDKQRRADAFAGMSGVYQAQNEDSLAVESALNALAVKPDYAFQHYKVNGQPVITADDLRILAAQSYFNQKKFTEAVKQVSAIDSDFLPTLKSSGLGLGIASKTDTITVSILYDYRVDTSAVKFGNCPDTLKWFEERTVTFGMRVADPVEAAPPKTKEFPVTFTSVKKTNGDPLTLVSLKGKTLTIKELIPPVKDRVRGTEAPASYFRCRAKWLLDTSKPPACKYPLPIPVIEDAKIVVTYEYTTDAPKFLYELAHKIEELRKTK